LLLSLVTQLSDQSHHHCDILDGLYLKHKSGAQKPSEDELIQCLKDMLTLSNQQPVHIINDTLDESPDIWDPISMGSDRRPLPSSDEGSAPVTVCGER
jgi:hypothetical protein